MNPQTVRQTVSSLQKHDFCQGIETESYGGRRITTVVRAGYTVTPKGKPVRAVVSLHKRVMALAIQCLLTACTVTT